VTAAAVAHLDAPEIVLLAVAGLAAGAVNAVAGGGSLISFPALLAVGLPSVAANVTNAVGVLPSYLGGSLAYREELAGQRRVTIVLAATSTAGALLGAWLLVISPEHVFERIVPFLILLACALLIAQPAISRAFRAPPNGQAAYRSLPLHLSQFAVSVYGGYFNGGLGILLLAVLALQVRDSLQRLNALKGVLSLVVGAASAAYFAAFAPVAWDAAAIMAVASFAGGHAGVGVARRMSPELLRRVVVAFGVCVAAWLLVDTWL
jgi:uncharacterized membrane protein YfcA